MTQYVNKPELAPTWAQEGDIYRPTSQEIAKGWPRTDTPPSRQRFNWILNYLCESVHYLLQQGIPEWDKAQTYPTGARVALKNMVYVALKESSGESPDTQKGSWSQWGHTSAEIVTLIHEISGSGVPAGTISYFPATRAPSGWLVAMGQELSRTDYGALWHYAQNSGNLYADDQWHNQNLLGSFSMGDGKQTFRLPDLRGLFVRSFDERTPGAGSRDIEKRALGSLQLHDTQSCQVFNPSSGSQKWTLSGLEKSAIVPPTDDNAALFAAVAKEGKKVYLSTEDERVTHETRPVNTALLACIRT